MYKLVAFPILLKIFTPLLIVCLAIPGDEDYELEIKRWRSKSGSKEIVAEFVKLEKNKLYLRKPDGTNITTVLENLYPKDIEKAMYLAGEADDLKQVETIQKSIDAFVASSKVRLDEFLVAHRESERAPYAGLAAAVVVARELNDAEKAERLIAEVINRIEKIRDYRPERHTTTLVSAYNNKAIIFMKQKSFAKACIAFTKALELSTDSDAAHLIHNANLVLGWASEKESMVELADPVRKKLTMAIQSRGDSIPGRNLTQGRLCYSFNFDEAKGKGVYQAKFNDFALIEDNCIVCAGDGMIDCRNCKEGVFTYRVTESIGYDPVRESEMFREVSKERPCDICNPFWSDLKKKGCLPCPHPECNEGRLGAPYQRKRR